MNREDFAEIDSNIVLFDGLDKAIIGFGYNWASQKDVAIYSYDKILKILVDRDNMDVDEAVEYIAFNIVGAYIGEYTPIVVASRLTHILLTQTFIGLETKIQFEIIDKKPNLLISSVGCLGLIPRNFMAST